MIAIAAKMTATTATPAATNRAVASIYRLAGGTIPFMRKYSAICP